MPTIHGYVVQSRDDLSDGGAALARCVAIVADAQHAAGPGHDGGQLQIEDISFAKDPFRSRPLGLKISNSLAAGDTIVLPLAHRAFTGTSDLVQTVLGWHKRSVRSLVVDLGIDTNDADGLMKIDFMRRCAEFNTKARGEVGKHRIAKGRAKGKFHGRPPFGLSVRGSSGDRHYEITEEFEVGKMIVSWRLAGHGWEAIRLHLRANRIFKPALPSDPIEWQKTGRPWSDIMIRRAFAGTVRLMNWIERGKVKDTRKAATDGRETTGQAIPGLSG